MPKARFTIIAEAEMDDLTDEGEVGTAREDIARALDGEAFDVVSIEVAEA